MTPRPVSTGIPRYRSVIAPVRSAGERTASGFPREKASGTEAQYIGSPVSSQSWMSMIGNASTATASNHHRSVSGGAARRTGRAVTRTTTRASPTTTSVSRRASVARPRATPARAGRRRSAVNASPATSHPTIAHGTA